MSLTSAFLVPGLITLPDKFNFILYLREYERTFHPGCGISTEPVVTNLLRIAIADGTVEKGFDHFIAHDAARDGGDKVLASFLFQLYPALTALQHVPHPDFC